jgi:hypothetical protein
MRKLFRFIVTPSHGFLEVPKDLGLQFKSRFSEELDDRVYLEEDEDAGRFINWIRENKPALGESLRNCLGHPIYAEDDYKLSFLIR